MESLYGALMALELSVVSWVLLFTFALGMMRKTLMEPPQIKSVMVVLALVGIVFYPATLGITVWDPYVSGYSPVGLLGLALCLSLYWAYKRYWVAVACILLAVLAHAFQIKNSTNLWDYFIDPFVVLWSWVYFLRLGWKKAYSGLFREAREQV